MAKDFYKLYVKEATPAVDSWSALCKIFREGFLPTEYTTHLRNKLRTKKQGLFQKTVIYIFEMQALCKQYNRKMPEEEIVDYIVQGLLPPIKERVIMLRPKGIKDLIAKANSVECGLSGSTEFGDPELTTAMAHLSVTENGNQLKANTNEPTNSELLTALNEMTKAFKGAVRNKGGFNKNYRFDKNKKPQDTRGSRNRPQCYYCKKVGHFQWQCRKKAFNKSQTDNQIRKRSNIESAEPKAKPNNAPVAAVEESDEDSDIISLAIKNDKNLVLIKAWVGCHKTTALVDCGSGITIITAALAKKTNLPIVDYEGPRVKVANGKYFKALGEIDIKITVMNGQEKVVAPVKAMVVECLAYDLLLGNDYLGPCGILVDCANQCISFKPRVWKIETPIYGYIHSKDTVQIPPRSSVVIDVTASEKNKLKKQNYVVYTDINSYAKHRVCFPNTIVNFISGNCSVEVTNFGRVEQSIMKGDILGCFELLMRNVYSMLIRSLTLKTMPQMIKMILKIWKFLLKNV